MSIQGVHRLLRNVAHRRGRAGTSTREIGRLRRVFQGLGELTHAEMRFLGELVVSCPDDGPIIEIGTLFGSSTLTMSLFKRPQQQLITVDNYSWNPLGLTRSEHRDITFNRLAPLIDHACVSVVDMDKADFYQQYSGSAPALVFLDAVHNYEETAADIRWARSVGAWMICGHDFDSEQFPGVVAAVNESGGASLLVGRLFTLASPS